MRGPRLYDHTEWKSKKKSTRVQKKKIYTFLDEGYFPPSSKDRLFLEMENNFSQFQIEKICPKTSTRNKAESNCNIKH